MIIVSPDSSSVISRQGVLQPCPIAAGIAQGTDPRTPQNRNFTGRFLLRAGFRPVQAPPKAHYHPVPARPVKAFRSSMRIRLALICTCARLGGRSRRPRRRCCSNRWPGGRYFRPPTGGIRTSRPRRWTPGRHSSSIGSAAARRPTRPRCAGCIRTSARRPTAFRTWSSHGDQARVPVDLRICGRERHRHPRAAGLSDSGRGPHDGELHRGWTGGRRRVRRSASAGHRSRPLDAVRDVGDDRWNATARADGMPARGRSSIWPATRAAPIPGRRPTPPASRFFPGSSATTKCRRRPRSPTRSA